MRNTMAMSSLGVVIYGSSLSKRKRISHFARQLDVQELRVLNNHAPTQQADELLGSNRHFEFSGYRALCDQISGEGPFIILNDTLWVNRWVGGWRRLLSRVTENQSTTLVYGDVRVEGGRIPERPNTYLASWVFVLPNRNALEQFAASLDAVMHHNYPPPSPEYARYLHRWFEPRWFGGWHGVRTPETIARKQHCIRMEHALSAHMLTNGLSLQSLGQTQPVFYALLRLVDRLRTLWHRLRTLRQTSKNPA